MTSQQKPRAKPNNPRFSSGPCTKRPGWTPNAVANALLGRSHRSQDGKARLKRAIERTRQLLDLPADFVVGIVPGSDTGAFEMAMWSLLGPRAVDVLAWESFGKGWATDVLKQLQLNNVRLLEADYGDLPDLKKVDWERDVIFTWNGTTSGVRVPNGDWIPSARKGLTFIDATSAIFAQPIDWSKADIVTYSWQKVLGGEAAHGMLILSPRAIERLESYDPPWPVPKLFRLKKDGKPNAAIFSGETINTPSMLCVEDYLDTLDWASSVGGAKGLMARADANAAVVFDWIERTPWIENLASDSTTRSNTSVCLKITDPEIASLSAADQTAFIKRMTSRLEHEAAAFDIAAHRDAPPGLRIWTGATVEKSDLEAVLPWLEWAFIETKTNS